jgi:thiosulfate/3-mercaptopyruvate sulfurtransferase
MRAPEGFAHPEFLV